MPEPADMVLPMLGEMRAKISARFDGVDRRLDTVDRRLAALEATQEVFKRALSAGSLLGRLLTGEFEGRIEALER
jgi:hypothetical protein